MHSTATIELEPFLASQPSIQPPSPATEPGRPLRAVTDLGRLAKKRASQPLVGALTLVVLVLGILAAQLWLSIVVSQGAYEMRALEVEQRDLGRVERVLSQNLDKLSSPQNLAENAAALGMVQNSTPATLRLSDRTISGDLQARTSAATANLVPNAALENLPIVDAEGLLVARDAGQAAAVAAASAAAPVAWEGALPAPDTH